MAHQRKRRFGVLVALLLLLAGVAFLGRGRLLAALGGFLVVRDPPARADAVLVLSGEPAERVWEAADLLREGFAPRIVLTTPVALPARAGLERLGIRLPAEPDLARQVALGLGVGPEAVLQVPATVESTEAEALAARAWFRAHGWQRVIVVTSPYHTRRARRLFREVFGAAGIEALVVPSRHGRFRAEDWWRDRSNVRDLIVEYQKLLFYALPGHAR